MTVPRFLLVLSREAVPDASAADLGALTGRLALWVAALRRWRLLVAVAVAPAADAGRVRGCLVVTASDLAAARRLARSCPAGEGSLVTVLPVRDRDALPLQDGDRCP
jgi:hypothetical protein